MLSRNKHVYLGTNWPLRVFQLFQENVLYLAILCVWLFHVSAILGILIGYDSWFLSKTPLNLWLSFLLVLVVNQVHHIRPAIAIFLFFVIGMLVEWVGTTTGFPFGTYHYGSNLGPTFDGVPYLIGINWAMLVLVTGGISSYLVKRTIARAWLGATLMVFLDFFIEPNASQFNFWHWENDLIPISNYIAWFVISFVLHVIFQRLIRKINHLFSFHLYLAQLTFFVVLYVFYHF